MGSDQILAACFFCGHKGKMYINPETSQWECKVCGESGNLQTFWHKVSAVFSKSLKGAVLRDLARDRGLSATTLKRWGVGYHMYGPLESGEST